MWFAEVVPRALCHDKMIALVKDPSKPNDDPGNHRPIFLQNIPYFKVTDRIVNSRLQKWIEILKTIKIEQGGFIVKRGTTVVSRALHCEKLLRAIKSLENIFMRHS